MANGFPTKELLQMIEERIPYGRFLTTAALLLAVLAVIVGSCSYLYRALVLPTIGLIVTLITTGKINLSALGRFVISVAVTAAIYFTFERLHRGSSRLMQEVLDSSAAVLKRNEEVLAVSQQANAQMGELVHVLEDLNTRVSSLENQQQ